MPGYGSDSTTSIRRRLKLCGAVFTLLLCVVLGRAIQLQLFQTEHLAEMAREQYLRSIELKPRRGSIVDAHGKPLAVSVDVESAYIDPKQFHKLPPQKQQELERKVAKALSMDTATLHKHLAAPSAFSWLKRMMPADQAAALHTLPLNKTGIGLAREFRRYYPQKEIASHVLGYVGVDDEGLDGIELEEDDALKGSAEEVATVRDAHGRQLFAETGLPETVPEGATVQLTLDSTLQQVAEEALHEGIAKSRSAAGMAVVMDPKTGAILALANDPTFNPNASSTPDQRRNYVVQALYEPGSVMKCFLLSAALSEKVVTPETPIDVSGGALHIGKRTIHDSHVSHSNYETVAGVLATSSNVGAARIGLKLGPEKLVHWLKQFGFGERTRLTLPGERRGVIHDPDHLGEIGTATTSFGQGMTATPLQIVTALSAIANDGRLMRPYIVQKVTGKNGEVLFEKEPESVRDVLTPAVAHQVREMMVGVTSKGGTGTEAAIPGYRVAGKTGTAQKADPETHKYGGKRFASFMGFVPADDPRLAIYVAYDDPKGNVYGGAVAAPVFRKIATAGLLQLGVPARDVDPLQPPQLAKAVKKQKAPPPVEESVDEDDDAPDEVDDVMASASNASSTVPDLHALSARAALRELHQQGFDAELEGSGRVVRQEPHAGRVASQGTKVHVVLEAG